MGRILEGPSGQQEVRGDANTRASEAFLWLSIKLHFMATALVHIWNPVLAVLAVHAVHAVLAVLTVLTVHLNPRSCVYLLVIDDFLSGDSERGVPEKDAGHVTPVLTMKTSFCPPPACFMVLPAGSSSAVRLVTKTKRKSVSCGSDCSSSV